MGAEMRTMTVHILGHEYKIRSTESGDFVRDVALYVERRRPELQGALLAGVEFGLRQDTGSAIRSYIVDVLMEGLERHAQRILYGSDHPAGMGGLSEIYRDLNDLPVSKRVKQIIRAETPKAFVSRFQPAYDWQTTLDQVEERESRRRGRVSCTTGQLQTKDESRTGD